jgi:hypothetical protein
VAVFVLLAGVLAAVGREMLESRKAADPSAKTTERDTTFVRSWLAITLVGAFVLFVAISFWIDDSTLRSALVGGLVANAGAATAFYFASKSSDQARRDILAAALPTTLVPDLVGKDLADVYALLASTPLRLEPTPAQPVAGWRVVNQHPAPNVAVTSGSVIAATFEAPAP